MSQQILYKHDYTSTAALDSLTIVYWELPLADPLLFLNKDKNLHQVSASMGENTEVRETEANRDVVLRGGGLDFGLPSGKG